MLGSVANEAAPTKTRIVVFWARRAATCDECREELPPGSFSRLEAGDAHCLACADLDHLVFLPRGDAALTRRAAKHSGLSAVVVRWSPARKRYERHGILVDEEALARAEAECLADADRREAQRLRAVEARAGEDTRFVAAFADAIRHHFPGCTADTADAIARHACARYSGRVGRTAAAKAFSEETIDLAVRAHLRHRHTTYDELLMRGWDRHEAREAVRAKVDELMARWLSPARGSGAHA